MFIGFIFLFHFHFHFHFSRSTTTTTIEDEIHQSNKCFLPFVTKPCPYDDRHLWCTFSLNSNEIRRTCNLSSLLLIFTTHHIELFLIDAYFDQIISRRENIIEKLIFDPKPIAADLRFTLKFPMWIKFIEIPLNNETFIITYIKDSLFYSKRQKTRSGESLLFEVLPPTRTTYQQMIIQNGTFHIGPLRFKYPQPFDEPSICGNMFACINENPCFFISSNRLSCDVHELNLALVFLPETDVKKYETVFINVYQTDVRVLHILNRSSFLMDPSISSVTFAMVNLVIVMRAGNLTIDANFFHSSDEIHVRIEHPGCNNHRFLIISDPDVQMKPIDLINYESREKEDIGCFLDYYNDTQKVRFRPHFTAIVYRWIDYDTFFLCFRFTSHKPFQLFWRKNNVPYDPGDQAKIGSKSNNFHHRVEMNIYGPFHEQLGDEHRIDITNRFGADAVTFAEQRYYSPFFTYVNTMYSVSIGSNVTFEAKIIGNPPPIVYLIWKNHHVQLFQASNERFAYRYTLLNVQQNDTGYYNFSVVPAGPLGTNISRSTYLEVLHPLRGMEDPKNISVEEGEDLHLSVQYSYWIQNVQWNFTDTSFNFKNWTMSYQGNSYHSHFTLKNVSIRDQGEYKVLAKDSADQEAHNSILVFVRLIVPNIYNCSNSMDNTTLWVYLSCVFRASYPRVQWFDPQGETLTESASLRLINSTARVFLAEITLKRIPVEKLGVYRFQVRNKMNATDHEFNVTFEDRFPTILNTNLDGQLRYAMPNENLSFMIDVNGFPFPEVTLFRNEKHGLTLNYTKIQKRFVTQMSNTYETIFYARVSNRAGSVETNRTVFYPRQAPAFILQGMTPSTTKIFLKRNETITLVTPQIRRGSPNMTEAIWYVKGKTIVTRINLTTSRCELIVEPAFQQDSITCTLENELGRASFVFALEFINQPQWITELSENIEIELGSSLTLTIEVLSNFKCDIQWLHRSIQGIPKHPFKSKLIGHIYIESFTISNINWEDAGFYSVTVTNAVGTIQSGVQVKVKSSAFNSRNDSKTNSSSRLCAEPICQCSTTQKILSSTVTERSTTAAYDRERVLRLIIAACLVILIMIILLPVFCTRKHLCRCVRIRKETSESTNAENNDKDDSSNGVGTEY